MNMNIKCPECGSNNTCGANVGDEGYSGYIECLECGEIFDEDEAR